MNVHKNVRLTPIGRAQLGKQFTALGLAPTVAAAGVGQRAARKWLRRFARYGAAGLLDSNSRPGRSRQSYCGYKRQRVVGLRHSQGLTCAVITERVGPSIRTVARICAVASVASFPLSQQILPVRRYQRNSFGELLCFDRAKLPSFTRLEQRVTGVRTRYTARVDTHVLNVAIGDRFWMRHAQTRA